MKVEEGRFLARWPSSSTEPRDLAPKKEEHGMSDEIRSTDEDVEAHGPFTDGPFTDGPVTDAPFTE
jgi:hypothetical protein